MEIYKTDIEGLIVVQPKVYKDNRGCFFEPYNKSKFEANNLIYNFVQDNQSESTYGVIRGLHYQIAPFAQAKFVRVLFGKVLDVVVDLRKNSETFGKSFSIELSDENKTQLLIPRGFAHGFSVLSEKVVFFYKCDNFYNKTCERGFMYNDPKINIDWKIPVEKQIVSEKDLANPNFDDAEKTF